MQLTANSKATDKSTVRQKLSISRGQRKGTAKYPNILISRYHYIPNTLALYRYIHFPTLDLPSPPRHLLSPFRSTEIPGRGINALPQVVPGGAGGRLTNLIALHPSVRPIMWIDFTYMRIFLHGINVLRRNMQIRLTCSQLKL